MRELGGKLSMEYLVSTSLSTEMGIEDAFTRGKSLLSNWNP
jgi:hypothetical protein